MKTIGNKTKTLVSSFVSLGVAASLIAGSTFALFTSESHTDIAITSGKVSVSATAQITKVYSAKWDESEHTYTDNVLFTGEGEDGEEYTFTNGGTAKYADKTLTLNNLSAGDGVQFTINAKNDSTISIKYQTVVTFIDGGNTDGTHAEDEAALYKALKITVDGDENISSNRTTAVSAWKEVTEVGGDIDPIEVDIHLPWNVDGVQGMTCNIVIGVYAVQSNGHDETKKDVYFVNSHTNVQEVLKNMEDGGIVAAGEAMTFTEDNSFAVPKDRNVILDVNGNTVNVDKKATEGQGIDVPAGSTLTITDSGKSAEGESGLNLNVNTDSQNTGAGITGSYALRVQEGGTLNLEGANLNIKNQQYGNHTVYVEGGTVNVDADSKIDFNGDAYAYGFYIRNGSTMNMNGGEFNSKGTVCQIMVGTGEEESELNLNAGTKINYDGATDAGPALQAYPNGVINIHEGSKITITGDLTNTDDSHYSDASAIRVVGGGTVNMDGGEILLNASAGWAYAIYIVCNKNSTEGKFFLHAKVVLSGTAKITAVGEPPQLAYFFGAQKNGEQSYDNESNKDCQAFIPDEEPCSLIIGKGVSITLNGTVVTKEDPHFALIQNDQDGAFGWKNKTIGTYTKDAIKDERFPENP